MTSSALSPKTVRLRASLRQSPDVILLGEMRDYETMQVAMTAAEMKLLLQLQQQRQVIR